jgi:hypothetical protein
MTMGKVVVELDDLLVHEFLLGATSMHGGSGDANKSFVI